MKEKYPLNVVFVVNNKCTFTYHQFMKERSLKVHDKMKPFECKGCSAKFSTKAHLKGHIESVYEGKKPFECNICDKKLSTKQSLDNHTKSKHV